MDVVVVVAVVVVVVVGVLCLLSHMFMYLFNLCVFTFFLHSPWLFYRNASISHAVKMIVMFIL